MKWFKFYGEDYLSDPKMLSLSASQRSCWLTLLAYGSVNDDGVIKFLSEEQLMIQAGVDQTHEEWDYTKGVLEKLQKLGMLTIDNGMITITNWRKRQEKSLTGYERIKRYREKHKNDNVNDNAMITLEENRIDKINTSAEPKEEIRIEKENQEYAYGKPEMRSVISKFEQSTKKTERIVAWYWKKKRFDFENHQQLAQQLGRDMKAASVISKADYTVDKIEKVAKKCELEFPLWTLETLAKVYHRMI